MTPTPQPDLNPLSVLVLVATAFGVAEPVAHALGAYGLIVVAWFCGAMIGLWRRPPVLRIGMAGFVVVSLIITLGVTVPVADVLAVYWPAGVGRGLALFMVALLIPAVGHNWVDVVRWLVGLARGRVQKRLDL